jgi:hypothetical protein
MSAGEPDHTSQPGKVRTWAGVRFALGIAQMATAAIAILLLLTSGVNSTSLCIAVLAASLTSISVLLFGGRSRM